MTYAVGVRMQGWQRASMRPRGLPADDRSMLAVLLEPDRSRGFNEAAGTTRG